MVHEWLDDVGCADNCNSMIDTYRYYAVGSLESCNLLLNLHLFDVCRHRSEIRGWVSGGLSPTGDPESSWFWVKCPRSIFVRLFASRSSKSHLKLILKNYEKLKFRPISTVECILPTAVAEVAKTARSECLRQGDRAPPAHDAWRDAHVTPSWLKLGWGFFG